MYVEPSNHAKAVTTADGEDMVAEALQKEELLLASIPVLDEWHGDRGKP